MCSPFKVELSIARKSVGVVCYHSILRNVGKNLNDSLFVSVPLTLQQLLYQDLLFFSENGKVDIKSHISLDFREASPHTIFAVSTYHRWVLWALKSIQIITKPNKVLHIPM